MESKCVKVYSKVLEKETKKGIPHVVIRYYDEWYHQLEWRVTNKQGKTDVMLMPPHTIYFVRVHQVPSGYTCHKCTLERQTTGGCDSAPVTHYFYLNPPPLVWEQTIFVAAIVVLAIIFMVYFSGTE